MNVIRMPRIIQAIMFMLQIPRAEVCKPNSNLLSWKHAAKKIDLMASRMLDLKVIGNNTGSYEVYETLNYCQRLLQNYQ